MRGSRARLAVVLAAAVATAAVLTGCTSEPDELVVSAGDPSATPEITAAAPPVADLDLQAWSAPVLPARDTTVVPTIGQLSPDHPMEPVDIAVPDGVGTLDVICAADVPATLTVNLVVGDSTQQSELDCAVGAAAVPQVLSLEYAAAQDATVQFTTTADAVYVAQTRRVG